MTLVHGMPEADYHAHEALSASGAKLLLKAPALFDYARRHPKTTRTFDYGHAAHARVLGAGAEVRVIPEAMLAANGAASTTAAKAFIAEARADGATPIKPEEAVRIDAMAEQLIRHRMAARLLVEGDPEVSLFAEHPTAGVPIRGRLDWLGRGIISDYKTTTCADPAYFARSTVPAYGYHISAANYLDLARANNIDAMAFAFIVQEKEPPYLVEVIEIDNAGIAHGAARMTRAAEIFRDCTESGLWPGYTRDDTWTTVRLPSWVWTDNNPHEEHVL